MQPDLNASDALRTFLPWGIGLAIALLVGAVVLLRLRALLHEDEDPAGDLQTLLRDAAELHREGDLTEAEFRSISSRVSRGADNGPRAEPPS